MAAFTETIRALYVPDQLLDDALEENGDVQILDGIEDVNMETGDA